MFCLPPRLGRDHRIELLLFGLGLGLVLGNGNCSLDERSGGMLQESYDESEEGAAQGKEQEGRKKGREKAHRDVLPSSYAEPQRYRTRRSIKIGGHPALHQRMEAETSTVPRGLSSIWKREYDLPQGSWYTSCDVSLPTGMAHHVDVMRGSSDAGLIGCSVPNTLGPIDPGSSSATREGQDSSDQQQRGERVERTNAGECGERASQEASKRKGLTEADRRPLSASPFSLPLSSSLAVNHLNAANSYRRRTYVDVHTELKAHSPPRGISTHKFDHTVTVLLNSYPTSPNPFFACPAQAHPVLSMSRPCRS